MEADLQSISFSVEAPYYTYGSLNPDTEAIWIVCHGLGQQAKYFMRRFDSLSPKTHFLIAPQGLSRYYMHDKYEKVGASWMTREFREMEIQNQGEYLDEIIRKELGSEPWGKYRFHLMGFSQGVATISRWAVSRKIPFFQLILWAGGFPHEITEDLTPQLSANAEVWTVVGNEDPFLTEERMETELKRLNEIFGNHVKYHLFEGKHEVQREVLQTLFFP
ncbi:MAG: alpha/beta hydrolase [Bacteroidota bacterium]